MKNPKVINATTMKPKRKPRYSVSRPAIIGPKISPILQMKLVKTATLSMRLSLYSIPYKYTAFAIMLEVVGTI